MRQPAFPLSWQGAVARPSHDVYTAVVPDNPTAELEEKLKTASTPGQFHSAVRQAMSALSSLSEGVCQHFSITLGCKPGCFLCCYLRVTVTPPEIFAIADHIQKHFAPHERERVQQRLTAHLVTIQSLTPAQHLRKNVECPLLHNGRCSMHSSRPFGCRYHHSQDFQACQFSYDHPEDLEYPGGRHTRLLEHVGNARKSLEEVYERAGFDMTSYELGSALNEALDSPVAWKRWRNRKKPFLRAVSP